MPVVRSVGHGNVDGAFGSDVGRDAEAVRSLPGGIEHQHPAAASRATQPNSIPPVDGDSVVLTARILVDRVPSPGKDVESRQSVSPHRARVEESFAVHDQPIDAAAVGGQPFSLGVHDGQIGPLVVPSEDRHVLGGNVGTELEALGVDGLDSAGGEAEPDPAVRPGSDAANARLLGRRDFAVDDAFICIWVRLRVERSHILGVRGSHDAVTVPVGALRDVPEHLGQAAVVPSTDPNIAVEVDCGPARVLPDPVSPLFAARLRVHSADGVVGMVGHPQEGRKYRLTCQGDADSSRRVVRPIVSSDNDGPVAEIARLSRDRSQRRAVTLLFNGRPLSGLDFGPRCGRLRILRLRLTILGRGDSYRGRRLGRSRSNTPSGRSTRNDGCTYEQGAEQIRQTSSLADRTHGSPPTRWCRVESVGG